ncbi:OLC1v1005324C2 [Oldenlandia corymbosa var. corymbosa]|uniref:OLC1v1005324C2 n=1 Tax=Oldenlandia corymbosa var. corymbosa TaxID=529605 RepID=A0AAV1DEG1_OLDCO|nr:OLC1v1005324C2 [Oldenlandia corymbosa var. corymbosa]
MIPPIRLFFHPRGTFVNPGGDYNAIFDLVGTKQERSDSTFHYSKVDAYALKMEQMQVSMQKWQASTELWCKQNGVPVSSFGVEEDQSVQGSKWKTHPSNDTDSDDSFLEEDDNHEHNLGD